MPKKQILSFKKPGQRFIAKCLVVLMLMQLLSAFGSPGFLTTMAYSLGNSNADIFQQVIDLGIQNSTGTPALDHYTMSYILGLYGKGDTTSIDSANQILDSVLPAANATINITPGSDAGGDAYDFLATAFTEVFYFHNNKMPSTVRERANAYLQAHVDFIERYTGSDDFGYRGAYPVHMTDYGLGHTNYALMKIYAMLIGSELVGDIEAQSKAREWFHHFADYTMNNGVTEFNTPTYGKIDIRCLSNIATRSQDAVIRSRASALTEYFWLDLAVHYWPDARKLTGASARTYSQTGNRGGTLFLFDQFITNTPWTITNSEEVYLAYMDYSVPEYIKQIATNKTNAEFKGLWTKETVEDWRKDYSGLGGGDGAFGNEYGKDRYTYFEPRYSLGTGGRFYAYQDRMLAADFFDDNLVSISTFLNQRAPLNYSGSDFLVDCLGNQRHIPSGGVTVQDKGVAMMVYNMDSSLADSTQILAPCLFFPMNAEAVYINNAPVSNQTGFHNITADDILYIKHGDVYAAVRQKPVSQGVNGYTPTYHYRTDLIYTSSGYTHEVGMLTTVLYNGSATTLSEKNARAGYVVEMATVDQYPTFEAFRNHIINDTGWRNESYSDGIWDLTYFTKENATEKTFRIKYDVLNRKVLDKWVDTSKVENPVFQINGSQLNADYSNGILTVNWNGTPHTIDLNRSVEVVRPEPRDIIVKASFDAYVRDGSYANNNYGTASSLMVKKDTADYNRKAYVKFNFVEYTGRGEDIEAAKLRLHAASVNTDASRTINIYGVTDKYWIESGKSSITWNNAPAGSTLVGSINVNNTADKWYEIDVTDYVRKNTTERDKIVSFLLVNEGTASTKGDVTFSSKEALTNHPELVISAPDVYYPSQDANVRDGRYADTNYGSSPTITVKNDTTPDLSRGGYLTFDFSNYQHTDTALARLKLKVSGVGSDAARTVKVYGVQDENWSESSLTWNNAPALNAVAITSAVVNNTTDVWYDFDVTDYVRNHLSDKKVSFTLIVQDASSESQVAFSSKETLYKPELILSEPVVLSPTDDTYGRDGTYANNNYGTAEYLNVKNDLTANFNRKTYLRFDFSTFNRSIASSAKLRLNVASVGTDVIRTVKLYGVSNNTWSESTLTWSNAPAMDSVAITAVEVNTVTGVWYEFDVNNYINSNMLNKKATFGLVVEGASAESQVAFNSKEAAGNGPELIIR